MTMHQIKQHKCASQSTSIYPISMSPNLNCLYFLINNMIQVIEVDNPIEPAVPLDSIKPEAWTFRLAPGGSGSAPGSCVVARSIVWPGAVAVAAGKRFVNIYMGHGIAYEKTSYSPPLPPSILNEWQPPGEDDEEGGISLAEQDDVREDPIIPEPEREEGDEDD